MPIKPQDLAFLLTLVLLFIKRDPKFFAIAGLVSIILSIPLFYKWVFFTAERLVVYAFIFFLVSVLLNLFYLRHNKSSTFFNDEPLEHKKDRKVLDK